MAVTTPFWLTVATAVLLDVHSTAWLTVLSATTFALQVVFSPTTNVSLPLAFIVTCASFTINAKLSVICL